LGRMPWGECLGANVLRPWQASLFRPRQAGWDARRRGTSDLPRAGDGAGPMGTASVLLIGLKWGKDEGVRSGGGGVLGVWVASGWVGWWLSPRCDESQRGKPGGSRHGVGSWRVRFF
jgi:hypothetical protein